MSNKLFDVPGVHGKLTLNADKIVACAPNTSGMCNVWFDGEEPWLIGVTYDQFVNLWKGALDGTLNVAPSVRTHEAGPFPVLDCVCEGCTKLRNRQNGKG